MRIIKASPSTNGLRHQENLDKALLSSLDVLKIKRFINRSNGRSSKTGQITSRHKGAGCKKLFRDVNFFDKDYFCVVVAISYDPFRGSFVSLNFDLEKKLFFLTLATDNVPVGSLIESNSSFLKEYKLGFRTRLKNIPPGSFISNLSLLNKKSTLAKAAGCYNQLLHCSSTHASLLLNSGKTVQVLSNTTATIGSISNPLKSSVVLGKAGKSRLLGRRPKVRGVAMNPVDHPHGGRTNGGRPSVTPWGLPTKCKFYLKKKK